MNSPEKPWQRRVNDNEATSNLWSSNFENAFSNENNTHTSSSTQHMTNSAPPLPPRPLPSDHSLNRSYNTPYNVNAPTSSFFSSPYCNPFANSYGGLGSYGGIGGYSSYGMNRYGYGNGYAGSYGGPSGYPANENDFSRIAEESSRQAFQSIESLVQAFSSVSMMLESTYFALHSSFRAVIGVADHFSRLRNHLAQILSSIALVRTIKYMLDKLLHLLRLKRDNVDESAWSAAHDGINTHIGLPLNSDGTYDALRSVSDDPGKSSWPIIIFFSVVLGTPWLIWRLLARITGSNKPASQKWCTKEGEHYLATALYDFQSDNPRELSFIVGQEIIVAPRDLQPRVKGWLLASDGSKVGLIPSNYIRILSLSNQSNQTK